VVVLLVLVETCWRLAPLCARHPSRLPGPAGQVLLRPSQFGSAWTCGAFQIRRSRLAAGFVPLPRQSRL